ncbi:MAG TPA: LL-diaminopimelate aminotransferase [Fibrobacteria bacterium]|nr:LL-diaminopimelate aminotransferase [Fibrobacteria bacterium]
MPAGFRSAGTFHAIEDLVNESYIQKLFAERIGGENYGKSNAIYKFEKIKRAKRQAIADFPNRPLIDFGIGENDEMAPAPVRAALKREVDVPSNRGYADNGILPYQEAAARYMERNFGVKLDPATQILHTIGSKPAYALLPAVFINPGDVTLFTVPGYPVAGTWTRYLGGIVHNLPLLPENDFFPDLDTIPAEVLAKAKILVINYPNSPSGKTATRAFYEKVVAFAKAHNIVVIQDAAHLPFTHGAKPLSFLEIPGAMDVGVEVHSMSKGWHMIGWRLGFVAGNPLVIKALGDVKDNSDSGQFKAIQMAAAAALDDDSLWKAAQQKYQRRQEMLVERLRALGFDARMPEGTYFLYAKAPKGIENGPVFEHAEAASQWFIREKSIVTVPFDDIGPHLRFSVTYEAPTLADEKAYMDAFSERLAGIRFQF